MFDRQQRKENEDFSRRREVINDLNFTYKRLLRLLPAIFRRAPEPRLANALKDQHELDVDSDQRLGKVAMDMGQAPGPCLCDEADRLVENVYNADRIGATPEARTWGIVRALRAVRVHVIRAWARLLADLEGASQAGFRKEAAAIQHNAAVQHHQLTDLTNELEDPNHRDADGDHHLRTG